MGYRTTAMLNISPIYLESATATYADFFESRLHRERMSTLGHWQGRGSQMLGLKSPVDVKALENLLNGFTPDGTRNLVADAGDPKRIAAWRTTLVAPSFITNVWAVAPKEAHIRIERGFAQAVNRALRCMEDVVTGVGTLAPKPGVSKAVMAVFRTRADWDTSPELHATALFLNLGLKSATQAEVFSPSHVMGLESGIRDFFGRALTARLDEQIGQFKTRASRRLKLEDVVETLSHRLTMDASSRATWGRRDDRASWNRDAVQKELNWPRQALDIALVANWTDISQHIGKPAELFNKLLHEMRNGHHTNGHAAKQMKQIADSSEPQKNHTEAHQESSGATKARKQFHGYSH